MRTSLLLLGPVLVAGALAAATSASIASPLHPGEHAARATVAAGNSKYGRILFDGHGRALYAFTHDPAGRSLCTGACAKVWPPYVVAAAARPAAGVKQSLLGTIRRADGSSQVTYQHRPLYYYVGDTNPGQVLCQDVTEFGGAWLVMRPSGRLVR